MGLQILFVAAAIAAPGCAAVSHTDPAQPGVCRVLAAENLPPKVSDGALCEAIQQAMAVHAPGVQYRVEVQVLSHSRLSAALTIGERTLPAQNLAVSDGDLSLAAINRFAETLASLAVRK